MARTLPQGSALREPLTYVLGTRVKVATLRVLAGEGAAMTQREVARRAGIQHRSAQLALDELAALGLVRRQQGGREFLVSLNTSHRLAAHLMALFAAEAEFFLALRQDLARGAATIASRARLVSVVLFGSVARAADGVESDCDLLLVARDKAGLDIALQAYETMTQSLRDSHGTEVRPVGYTLPDARRRLRAGAAPFNDIARDGIVLFGGPLAEALGG